MAEEAKETHNLIKKLKCIKRIVSVLLLSALIVLRGIAFLLPINLSVCFLIVWSTSDGLVGLDEIAFGWG